MRPVKRGDVDKASQARQFRHNVGTTKSINLRAVPMRGGWRL